MGGLPRMRGFLFQKTGRLRQTLTPTLSQRERGKEERTRKENDPVRSSFPERDDRGTRLLASVATTSCCRAEDQQYILLPGEIVL